MPKKKSGENKKQQLAIFFLEGYSEEIFYKKMLDMYLKGVPKIVINAKGLYNIHKTVMGKTVDIVTRYPDYNLRIYCCIDRESRDKAPELDIEALRKDMLGHKTLKNKVLSADIIMATQMLESWFFYDIEGIYKFLRYPNASRNIAKYHPVEKTRWQDLFKLFRDVGKLYIKGERSENFIEHLDLEKIYAHCRELREGIELVAANSTKNESSLK